MSLLHKLIFALFVIFSLFSEVTAQKGSKKVAAAKKPEPKKADKKADKKAKKV
jgi:hypothetical protein